MLNLLFDDSIYEVEEYTAELVEAIKEEGIKEIYIISFGSIIGSINFDTAKASELEDEVELIKDGNKVAILRSEEIKVRDGKLMIGC